MQGVLVFGVLHIAVSNKLTGMLLLVQQAKCGQVEIRQVLLPCILPVKEELPQGFITAHMTAHLVPLQREQAVHRRGHIPGRLTGHRRGEGDAFFDAQHLQMIFQPLPLVHRPRQAQEHLIMTVQHHIIPIPP